MKIEHHILLLCGVFAKENETEVIAQAKKSVEFSANQMQLKLIRGLKEIADTQVISAPFVGHYPNQSRSLHFRDFSKPQQLCEYVPFNNLWGFRNISRTSSLKKAVREFAATKNRRKLIVVYSAHEPFLAAAAYAKRIDPDIRICFIVPDLPQYMNLETKRSFLYDFFKKIDIKSIEKYIKSVDSSVVLTNQMAEVLHLDNRPYFVAEGITEAAPKENRFENRGGTVNIVYTGKIYFRFGIRILLDAFSRIKGENFRLILCGNGDAAEYVKQCARQDSRIVFTGQISPTEAKRYIDCASVLVNPRPNNEEYTKYSFPSKNIDYLLSGKPTVAFFLDGMPECYKNFLYTPNSEKEPVEALSGALKAAITAPEEEVQNRHRQFIKYASQNLCAQAIAEKIVKLNFDREMYDEENTNSSTIC